MKSGQKLLRSQLSILDPSTHSVTSLIFLDIPYQKVRSRQWHAIWLVHMPDKACELINWTWVGFWHNTNSISRGRWGDQTIFLPFLLPEDRSLRHMRCAQHVAFWRSDRSAPINGSAILSNSRSLTVIRLPVVDPRYWQQGGDSLIKSRMWKKYESS